MNGTGRRIEALVAALVAVAHVEVLVSTHEGTPSAPPPPGHHVQRLTRSRSRIASLAAMATGAPLGRPLVMGFYRRPAVAKRLSDRIAAFEPDVVVAQGIGGLALCEGVVDPARVIYDSSDALHETFASLAASLRGFARLQWALDLPLLRGYFRRRLRQFKAVVTVSQGDTQSFKQLGPDAHYVLVPNGATPRATSRRDPGGHVLLFVGDQDYEPNRDGVRWFLDHVLPSCPEPVQLRTVGPGTPASHPRLEHRGFVPRLIDEWDAAVAAVVPTFAGGGTHLKVVEALAAGIPVIATEFGARGLGLSPDIHYLQADTPSAFVEAISRVTTDATLRARLSAAGVEHVREKLSWSRSVLPLIELIEGGSS